MANRITFVSTDAKGEATLRITPDFDHYDRMGYVICVRCRESEVELIAAAVHLNNVADGRRLGGDVEPGDNFVKIPLDISIASS